MRTNWQDPGTTEILSSHISGLQEAVGKIEDSIGLQTTAETAIALSEVYITDLDRYRIYQAAEGKRNWVASPAPVIKKNGAVISTDFTIDYGGGAIVLSSPALSTDVFTADFTRTNSTHAITPASIGAESKTDADAHKAENAAQFNAIEIKLSDYNSYASDPDETGIYTIVDYKRADGTLYMKSTLSGGEAPNYTTDTWQFYDEEGITVIATKTWTFSYDAGGKITSKVVA